MIVGGEKDPKRPCPFCGGKMFARLTRHIQSVHKDEDEVMAAMKLPAKDRNQAFNLLRRKGCHAYNLDKLKEENFDPSSLMKERKSRKKSAEAGEINQGDAREVCSLCKGYFVRKHFRKHVSICSAAEGNTHTPAGIQLEILSDNITFSEAFQKNILKDFWKDEIGNFCRSDTYIKEFGYHLFRIVQANIDKSDQNRKTIMAAMRMLAKLFFHFKEEAAKNNINVTTSLDMFKADNFQIFMDAVNEIAQKEDGGIKSGTKRNVGHLIKNVTQHLRGKFIWEKKKELVNDVDDFNSLFSNFKAVMFHSAEYNIKKNRQQELRCPKNLPDEQDVKKLQTYTVQKMKSIDDHYEFLEKSEYILLRNLVVSRLTLYNARRGGEPCRLTYKEWENARNDVWINENQKNCVTNPEEQDLLKSHKLTYQSGKCVNQTVPILFPKDTWKALEKLADPVIRQAAGISPDNIYLFPHIKNSRFHASGWNCVSQGCDQAGLSKKINATQMSHWMSTVYARLDHPDTEKEAFYRHMGHSEEINKHVYQCPLGIEEITKVGRFLRNIDQGKYPVLKFCSKTTFNIFEALSCSC